MLLYKQDQEILVYVFDRGDLHIAICAVEVSGLFVGNNSHTLSVRLNFIAGAMLLFPLKTL